jgi:hypothetical protein
MNNFNKFKKKMLIEAIIKSVVISYSICAICFAVPYLIFYFAKIEFTKTIILLLSCIGGATILCALCVLILYPTKIKAAKRLDKELNLNQKVQTMVEFSESDTDMAKIQREDTLNILGNTELKKFSMRFGVFFFVLLALMVVFTTSVVVTATIEEEDPSNGGGGYVEPSYDLDDWTTRALLDLIEVVDKSSIDTELKTPVVQNLRTLLSKLEEVTLEVEMKSLVIQVIADTTLRLDLVNSNNEVFTELKGSDAPIVRELVTQINALNVTNVNNCIENFYVYLCGDEATISQAISDLDTGFKTLINGSKLNKDEKLTKALLKFANDLSKANGKDGVRKAIDDNLDLIVDIIKVQTENNRIIDYTIEQLKIIFGLNENKDDENSGSSDNKPTVNPVEPPKLNPGELQGGYGTGEVLFGSDDIIFDIEKGTVEYGEVIAKYYGQLVGMFNDGTIPEEYKELFDKYFDGLFGFYEEE